MADGICANCCRYLGRSTGVSSIYRSDGEILCEPCWLEEDDLIEEEGTNSPDYSEAIKVRLERYRRNQRG